MNEIDSDQPAVASDASVSSRPQFRNAWAGLVAGASAFVGMFACEQAIPLLSIFFAPMLGVLLTTALFRFLLPRVPRPRTPNDVTESARIAAIVAFLTAVAQTSWFARRLEEDTVLSRMASAGLSQMIVLAGIVIGLLTAKAMHRITRRYYGRSSDTAAPADHPSPDATNPVDPTARGAAEPPR